MEDAIMEKIAIVVFAAMVLVYLSGCMQVLGVKELDAWGLKVSSTQGFDISAGVMQYDGADNQKSMNLKNTKGGNDGRY